MCPPFSMPPPSPSPERNTSTTSTAFLPTVESAPRSAFPATRTHAHRMHAPTRASSEGVVRTQGTITPHLSFTGSASPRRSPALAHPHSPRNTPRSHAHTHAHERTYHTAHTTQNPLIVPPPRPPPHPHSQPHHLKHGQQNPSTYLACTVSHPSPSATICKRAHPTRRKARAA
jgi:hypothetical protein